MRRCIPSDHVGRGGKEGPAKEPTRGGDLLLVVGRAEMLKQFLHNGFSD